MWLFFQLLADALNSMGLEMKFILSSRLRIDIEKLTDRWAKEGKLDESAELLDILNRENDRVDVPWTKETVHDALWVPLQKAMTGKESTTEMNTCDPSEIHEILMKHLGEKFEVPYIPWPSHEGDL